MASSIPFNPLVYRFFVCMSLYLQYKYMRVFLKPKPSTTSPSTPSAIPTSCEAICPRTYGPKSKDPPYNFDVPPCPNVPDKVRFE